MEVIAWTPELEDEWRAKNPDLPEIHHYGWTWEFKRFDNWISSVDDIRMGQIFAINDREWHSYSEGSILDTHEIDQWAVKAGYTGENEGDAVAFKLVWGEKLRSRI